MTVNDTARSLLQFFGTWLEWGQRGTLGIHDASPELMALTMAILDVVPAAWKPYRLDGRDDGYVMLYQPQAVAWKAENGWHDRCLAVHDVPRPPRYVEPDDATAHHTVIDRATVAALVGLASIAEGRVACERCGYTKGPASVTWDECQCPPPVTRAGKLHEIERLHREGRITPDQARHLIDEPDRLVTTKRFDPGHGCARVMATLTDEDIAKAERSDRHDANDSIGGE